MVSGPFIFFLVSVQVYGMVVARLIVCPCPCPCPCPLSDVPVRMWSGFALQSMELDLEASLADHMGVDLICDDGAGNGGGAPPTHHPSHIEAHVNSPPGRILFTMAASLFGCL